MVDILPMGGKTVVITGATSGIGLASMVALAKEGAYVIGVGRNEERCLAAKRTVLTYSPESHVKYLLADLSLQSQVRQLAANIRALMKQERIKSIDVLVNNAGIYSGKLVRTQEGIELTLAVNHIAPFLLTHELMPFLKNALYARIITVSSASHYCTRLNLKRLNHPLFYFGLQAYRVSKLANVLFTYQLNRRLKDTSVRAFAVDPGLVNTEIGMKRTGGLSYFVWNNRRVKGVQPEVPAKTITFLSREGSLQDANQYYWRDCRPKEPSRQAQREDLAQRLWEVTSKLCGTGM